MDFFDPLHQEFEQLSAMRGLNNAVSQFGACHSFTLHWLRMMLDNQPSEAIDRMSALYTAIRENSALQKTFNSLFESMKKFSSGLDIQHADQLCFLARELKSRVVVSWGTVTKNQVVDIVRDAKIPPKQNGIGFLYGFSHRTTKPPPDMGYHTIGFFRQSSGKLCAFDANYGEFQMDPKEFGDWLELLSKNYIQSSRQYMKQVERA